MTFYLIIVKYFNYIVSSYNYYSKLMYLKIIKIIKNKLIFKFIKKIKYNLLIMLLFAIYDIKELLGFIDIQTKLTFIILFNIL